MLPTDNLPNCVLSCFIIPELLTMFLDLNICSLRIHINELCLETLKMLCGYAATLSIPVSQPVSTLQSTLFVVYAIFCICQISDLSRFSNSVFVGCSRRAVGFQFPKKICPTKPPSEPVQSTRVEIEVENS